MNEAGQPAMEFPSMEVPGEKTTHMVMDKFMSRENARESAEHVTKIHEVTAGECCR